MARRRGIHTYLMEKEWINDSSGSTAGRVTSYIALVSVVFGPLAIYLFALVGILRWDMLRLANTCGGFWKKTWEGAFPLEDICGPVTKVVLEDPVIHESSGWFKHFFSYPATHLGIVFSVMTIALFTFIFIGWLLDKKGEGYSRS